MMLWLWRGCVTGRGLLQYIIFTWHTRLSTFNLDRLNSIHSVPLHIVTYTVCNCPTPTHQQPTKQEFTFWNPFRYWTHLNSQWILHRAIEQAVDRPSHKYLFISNTQEHTLLMKILSWQEHPLTYTTSSLSTSLPAVSTYSPLRLYRWSASYSFYLDHDLSQRRAVVYKQGFQDNEASEEIRCNRPRKDTPRTFCWRSHGGRCSC